MITIRSVVPYQGLKKDEAGLDVGQVTWGMKKLLKWNHIFLHINHNMITVSVQCKDHVKGRKGEKKK